MNLWRMRLVFCAGALLLAGACAVRSPVVGRTVLVPSKSDSTEARAELEKIRNLPPAYAVSREDLDIYLRWIERTIERSAKDKAYAIIVDKAAYRLCLIKDGKVRDTYPIELGADPINDKMREGDRRTPEGMYRVSRVLQGAQTSWFKALEINYPSAQDLREFRDWRSRGVVRRTDSVGGFIQIHGEGSGKPGNAGGQNWTDGCISLSNAEMTRVFEAARALGTPVTIVRYGAAYYFAIIVNEQSVG